MSAYRSLEDLPGIGPAMARDLRDLGMDRPADVAEGNPQAMYDDLCRLRDRKLDRCVLYVFRCAVFNAAAGSGPLDPEVHKWWNWTDHRLATNTGLKERHRG